MTNQEGQNFSAMHRYFFNSDIFPCFSHIETRVIKTFDGITYEIFLYQAYDLSNECASDKEKYHISKGHGKTMNEAMENLNANMKVLK